jgi:thiosulfate dehydrogenase [quinone] large subunit
MPDAPAVPRPLAWPFRSRLASPLWLAVRLYLGWVWLHFGTGKIRGGWLTMNPMESMLEAIAAGHTRTPFAFYRPVARLLLDAGADPVLSAAIPLAEVALGALFLAGVLLVPAATGGILLNLNLILAGIASVSFDGRIIVLQLLLLAAWRVAGYLGLGTAAAALRRRPASQPVERPSTAAHASATRRIASAAPGETPVMCRKPCPCASSRRRATGEPAASRASA